MEIKLKFMLKPLTCPRCGGGQWRRSMTYSRCWFSFKLHDMKSMLDIPSIALRTSCSISDMVCFSLLPSFTCFFYCMHLPPCPCSRKIGWMPAATISCHLIRRFMFDGLGGGSWGGSCSWKVTTADNMRRNRWCKHEIVDTRNTWNTWNRTKWECR
jgi:hypothetical protein